MKINICIQMKIRILDDPWATFIRKPIPHYIEFDLSRVAFILNECYT